VSGGGSVVSGTGTDSVGGLSLCCAMPAWLGKTSTKTSAVGASKRANRALFTTFFPQNVKGKGPQKNVRLSLTDSAHPVTFFPTAQREQASTVAILHERTFERIGSFSWTGRRSVSQQVAGYKVSGRISAVIPICLIYGTVMAGTMTKAGWLV